MTENIPQTSASARIEAARKALADYRRSQPSDYERAYADPLADALRALITPPSVGESVEQIAGMILDDYFTLTCEGMVTDPSCETVYEALMAAANAGIQSAHETWESADVPSQEMMLRWLGIEYTESAEFGYVYIPLQQIEREEI